MEINLSAGDDARLKRIMDLRKCSAEEAISFAVRCGWLGAEKLERDYQERMHKRMAKGTGGKPEDNKAPITGTNKNNDNKRTDTGKPYPPGRPKAG